MNAISNCCGEYTKECSECLEPYCLACDDHCEEVNDTTGKEQRYA
jgi:uncharacterized metal-binding protein YceD (DUF177 family)